MLCAPFLQPLAYSDQSYRPSLVERHTQDYFFGLTADSDSRFKIDMSQSSPFEGRTARKGGEPTEIMIKCDPQGADGVYVAHLCFILPEEPTFSKFYKITCTAGDATRDPAPGA